MKINVKLKGMPEIIQVSGETFEDDKNELRVKDSGGQVIAKFRWSEIGGWWIEQSLLEKLSAEQVKLIEEASEATDRYEEDSGRA
jgi:hypothetical protein